MENGITMSNHISNLRILIRQLVEVNAPIYDDNAKAILLNNLPLKYENVVFTLSQIPSQAVDGMNLALLG